MLACFKCTEYIFAITKEEISIGGHGCDFVLEKPGVAKRHATLTFDASEQAFALKDLGSSCGTVVNDVFLSNESVRLFGGEVVRFGYSNMSFTFLTQTDLVNDVENKMITPKDVIQKIRMAGMDGSRETAADVRYAEAKMLTLERENFDKMEAIKSMQDVINQLDRNYACLGEQFQKLTDEFREKELHIQSLNNSLNKRCYLYGLNTTQEQEIIFQEKSRFSLQKKLSNAECLVKDQCEQIADLSNQIHLNTAQNSLLSQELKVERLKNSVLNKKLTRLLIQLQDGQISQIIAQKQVDQMRGPILSAILSLKNAEIDANGDAGKDAENDGDKDVDPISENDVTDDEILAMVKEISENLIMKKNVTDAKDEEEEEQQESLNQINVAT